MTNICKNCNENVTPDPDDGHCPKCGKRDGYTVSSTMTFRHKIEDGITKYHKQIERLKQFQEIYKGTKVEENLQEHIKKLEKIIQELTVINQKKSVDDTANISENVVVKKGTDTKTKTFSADAILVESKAESKLDEGDRLVDATNGEIFKELKELRIENQNLHQSNSRLSKLGIIGTIAGVGLGLIGSYLIPIITQPHIIIVNATNGNILP